MNLNIFDHGVLLPAHLPRVTRSVAICTPARITRSVAICTPAPYTYHSQWDTKVEPFLEF